MQVRRLMARRGVSFVSALILMAAGTPAFAQHDGHSGPHASTPTDPAKVSALVQIVRQATERFKDPEVAKAEGYVPLFGCVTGSSEGAMGIHFVNLSLVGDGRIDPRQPEIVLYEPLPNGGLRLTGADYLVYAQDWNANNQMPPEMVGQLFHFFEAPNRFGLPEFFTLHVWAWKDNPQGTFANWNPNVSCDAYSGQ